MYGCHHRSGSVAEPPLATVTLTSMARGFRATLPDKSLEPTPRLVETHDQPRPWTATWFDPPFLPELDHVDQAYGICFTKEGEILLICSHDVDGVTPYWNLPGGGLMPGETLEQCLTREVAEEACARVIGSVIWDVNASTIWSTPMGLRVFTRRGYGPGLSWIAGIRGMRHSNAGWLRLQNSFPCLLGGLRLPPRSSLKTVCD